MRAARNRNRIGRQKRRALTVDLRHPEPSLNGYRGGFARKCLDPAATASQ